MVGERLFTRSQWLRVGTRRVIAVLGALAVLGGLEREGHVTQVSMRGIGLAEVVQRSTLIVVAHRAEPRERLEKIAIDPKPTKAVKTPGSGPAAPPKPIPPFVRVWSRFVVEEVLRGPQTLAGQVVEAQSANDGNDLYIHRLYYVEGVGESPIYDQYASSIDWKKGEPARVILFLTEHAGVRAFAAQGAFEQLSRRDEVVKAAAAKSEVHNPTGVF